MSAPARLEDVELATRLAAEARPGRPVRLTLEQLLHAFGEPAPTPAARRRAAAALELAGLAVAPDLSDAAPGATISIARRGTVRPPLGLILSGLAVLVFVVWIASSGGGEDPGDRPLPEDAPVAATGPTSATGATGATGPTGPEEAEPTPEPERAEPTVVRIKPYTRATICVEDARRVITQRVRIARILRVEHRRIGLLIERGRVRIEHLGHRTIRVRNPPAYYELTEEGARRIERARRTRCGEAYARRQARRAAARREREAAERAAAEAEAEAEAEARAAEDDELGPTGQSTPDPTPTATP